MNRFSKLNETNKSNVDKDCETCTDFKDWLKSNNDKETKDPSGKQQQVDDTASYYNKCPLFRDQLGRASWSVLHTIAAYYPEKPTEQEQTSMKGFIQSFAQFFPCRECASDFREE
jgi:FAD-linked sulfhydryl oxidase